MSNERVNRFNYVIGNTPKTIEDDAEQIWQQLTLQAKLVLEEAQEMYDAAENRDIVEYLDGVVDVWFLREYCDTLLKSLGVDVTSAKYDVCNNNELKFSTSKELIERSAMQHTLNGNPCFVDEVEYEGQTYYVAKRTSDRKVQKPIDFPKVDLSKCIPNNTLEHLKGGMSE